jgi:maleamate amidohydrolase
MTVTPVVELPEPDWNAEVAAIRTARSVRTRLGPGVSPAILVVDFQRAFTQHDKCGPEVTEVLERTAQLLTAARAAGVPVIYLGVVLDDFDQRNLAWKARSSLTSQCLRGDPRTEIHPLVAMQDGDHLIEKAGSSGFFETDLVELLTGLEVDELIMVGTSTSGCVRCTAVDAAARSYRVTLVEDCCHDFRRISGEVALFDIQDRYGDVIGLDEVLGRLAARPAAVR